MIVYCANCHTPKDYPYPETRVPPQNWWWIEGPTVLEYICSLTCLTEFTWRLREAQPKLSKSSQS